MISEKLIDSICKSLEKQLPVKETIAEEGELHIDKLLPYICVYRYKEKDPNFSGLLKTQASYLIVKDTVDITHLLECLSRTISTKLNAFLIIEMWPFRKDHDAELEIFCPKSKAPATIAAFKEGFDELHVIYPEINTTVHDTHARHPEHLQPLIEIDESKQSGALIIGLGIPTIYERPEENQLFSIFYRKFSSRFSEIVKRAVYEFIRVQTSNPFNHYLMLGKTNLDRITLEADSKLAKISEKMSFLLRTTPVNASTEWERFKKNKFQKTPAFNYRLIALDPELEKRKLYQLPIDKVDDPTLSFILRDKRLEIEKQLTMLEERSTHNFRFIGESLYGPIKQNVLEGAAAILKKFPEPMERSNMERADCHQFAEHAQKEIDYYKEHFTNLDLGLEIRKDVAGIMVSKTKLFVSENLSMDASRCDALVQHEVGTHILTYCNGKRQPLEQMYAGFAGYDRLQEGLAVLAEYLVDGLTKNRLRLLAGRVEAANSLVNGASFIETFNMLHHTYNFTQYTAYYITMRVYRGGGLTKDAVYLAGLMNCMAYLKNGGNIETLYTGKFNTNHVPLIEELLHRDIVKKPLLPRFLERDIAKKRLQKLKEGIQLTELLN
ncbi:flavohemoglobin expression-modulating QEGLA motif protein [Marixanthomonas spongiae]|uniref:DUF1704 domain-containing protein n=1 Tax=Marixanthomonas spongiae TaxID=2174845 RepID=A0A2U0I0T7_9FLAO|nr:tyrosine/phenylalanine carboxypeptidase domain-containing protein [Marixanthomonas spongiae]PVW14610.1 hypothetical protein DDV96_08770 [Marixanthomonas spongiae]